jgi:UDP-glucose 4-epimerase
VKKQPARPHSRPLVAVTDDRGGRQQILVLGAGFIGARTARQLVRAGHEVLVVTRTSPRPEYEPLLDGATVVLGDVGSMSNIAGLLAEVDHVIYAVGSSSPTESDLDPATDITMVVPPVVRLLELLRLKPAVGLTFLSSGGAIYGNTPDELAHELTPPEPISSYGILKLTTEKYLSMYADLHGIPTRILRIANAYGPGQPWAKGQGLIARLMRCALTGEHLPVFGNGHNVRDYVYIDDIANVIVDLIAQSDTNRILNVGSGIGHTILDLVELVEAHTGRSITLDYRPARSFDVRSIVLDISRLNASVCFKPTDIDTGLRQTWRSASLADAHTLATIALPGTSSAAL